jgi:hypothetical protein
MSVPRMSTAAGNCSFLPAVKAYPGRKTYLPVLCASGATIRILFAGKCGKLRNRYKPVVNTTYTSLH